VTGGDTIVTTTVDPSADVVETHSAIVFFVGERAYKLKKPVQFGFLDFRRREVRQQVCHREVALNRRLAPDVYLGVADVAGPDGLPCDHLVVMRRMPSDRRLSAIASAGAMIDDDLRRLAHLLASFHAAAATSHEIEGAASRDAQVERWTANTADMRRFVGPVLDASTSERVIDLAQRYLAGRAALFADRIAGGHARDGHGDLLADDIFLLPDGPRVLDCIEFDDRLRWGDTLADVAFLAMDLERLGRADLGTRFLELYREFAADTWPASLAHHYIAYRAQVRAKVACLRWEQGDPGSGAAARDLLALAARNLDAGRVRLVLVGGLPGTGKSTLAAHIAAALGAVLLRSDVVRKQSAGVDLATPAPARFATGLYRPEVTEATYGELMARARVALGHGESVVLDASWSRAVYRERAATVAAETSSGLHELHCTAPTTVIEARLSARSTRGDDASDADARIARALAEIEAPWPTATPIDTTGAVGDVLHTALVRLGAR